MQHTKEGLEPRQRTDEWDRLDEHALKYHEGQWADPKRSTVAFAEFVEPLMNEASTVLDLGCGAGAATAYLAALHPRASITGIEYSAELVRIGAEIAGRRRIANLGFRCDDWFNLASYGDVDGVVSLQTLSWMPEMTRPMVAIFERIRPRWVALSSLFHDGDISCAIEVHEHVRDRRTFYNVYSLPELDRLCRKYGYRVGRATRFDIDVDLPLPANRDLMGTHTVAVAAPDREGLRRLQISGPLLMNWWFVDVVRA